jgi:lipopolysaccharide cholinephosphotransferase
MTKNIFKQIFSIEDYGNTHHILRLFGVKVKFPKSEFAKKKKESPYYYYKKNNIDITTLPPATGQIRDIQLANLALLNELDHVCKQNGLTYWLDFGSLLGAVRHKGFIPWDDDIDTGMMREDYGKIIEAFEKSSRNSDIYAGYVKSAKNPCQYYIKVQHRRCPNLFVDIFPYDYYGQKLDKDEQYRVTSEIKSIRKKMQKSCETDGSTEHIESVIESARAEILNRDNFVEQSDLVWGVDFNHGWKNWLYSYDTIFPLSEVEFEGVKIPCANKKEEFLSEVYGDYMAYPKKIGVGHNMYAELTEDEKKIIKELGARL